MTDTPRRAPAPIIRTSDYVRDRAQYGSVPVRTSDQVRDAVQYDSPFLAGPSTGNCGTDGGAPPGSALGSAGTPGSAADYSTFDTDPNQDGGRVFQTPGSNRRIPIQTSLGNAISSSLQGTGLDFQGTSLGQVARSAGGVAGVNRTASNTTNHDNGWAVDGDFIDTATGQKVLSSSAAGRARLAPVVQRLRAGGITQFGHDYMGSGETLAARWHLGMPGPDQGYSEPLRTWGGDTAWYEQALAGTSSPGPGDVETASGTPNSAPWEAGSQDPCTPYDYGGGGAGCSPISAASPAAAASISQGLGMDLNGVMNQALSAVGGTGLGGIQNALQSGTLLDLLGTNDMGSLIGGALGDNLQSLPAIAQNIASMPTMNLNGLSSVLNNVTSQALSAVQGLGSNILPSLTGVIPSAVTNILGGGSLTGLLQQTAGSILQNGVPGFGNLNSVLSSAIGAMGQAENLLGSIVGAESMIFRNALGQIRNLQNLPGFDISNLTTILNQFDPEDEGPMGADDIFKTFSSNLSKSVNLIGAPGDVLKNLLKGNGDGTINGFSTSFFDYQSFVTQGLGNLTDDLRLLGEDLGRLGSLGDLQDIMNIGTARQVARNIVESGAGVDSGLIEGMSAAGVSLQDTFNWDKESTFHTILANIQTPYEISATKSALGISPELSLQNLSDLTNTDKILPKSKEFNRFDNLNHIAMTLLLCSKDSVGNLQTFRDLGLLMKNMESVNMHSELMNEVAPIRLDEIRTLLDAVPARSKFSPKGPVLADFIGSAAGYIHDHTMTRIANIMKELDGRSELDTYRLLMTTLTETLKGTYTDQIYEDIVVPGIGTFTVMDDAVLAIVSAIETELTNIKSLVVNDNRSFFARMITQLESLFWTSAEYLAHEKTMRGAYGVDIGETSAVERAYGDGSSIVFFLNNVPRGLQVYVNGVKSNGYSRNGSTVTFAVAPSAGENVEFVYERDSYIAPSRKSDSWALAGSLENWATQVGYGGPADYLRRLITPDRHGQRLDALMKQARNKERAAEWGISCPGWNRVLNSNGDSTNFKFASRTGIWSENPQRASEIWLENLTNKPFETYLSDKMKDFNGFINDDLSAVSQGHLRQLIFLKQEGIVITDKMAEIYSQVKDIYKIDSPTTNEKLKLSYSTTFTDSGFALGKYTEIVSEIMRSENIVSEVFETKLTDESTSYLSRIGIDIAVLTGIIQRTLLYNRSQMLGVDEQETRNLFGMPSVSKLLLLNISQDF